MWDPIPWLPFLKSKHCARMQAAAFGMSFMPLEPPAWTAHRLHPARWLAQIDRFATFSHFSHFKAGWGTSYTYASRKGYTLINATACGAESWERRREAFRLSVYVYWGSSDVLSALIVSPRIFPRSSFKCKQSIIMEARRRSFNGTYERDDDCFLHRLQLFFILPT